MFGFLLISLGTLFEEISGSIGKFEVQKKLESIYTMAFLNIFWQVVIYVFIITFVRQRFIFSAASLPTFGLRALLEVIQAHVSILALVKADRSTFSFMRTGTIPLLLFFDLLLGYSLYPKQLLGIGFIFFTLFFLLINHGFEKQGIGLVIFSTINAAFTITLFKYDISHFNSVEAEQFLITAVLLIYFFFSAVLRAKENPIKFFYNRVFFAQSASHGIGSILQSFAYFFAPASIILAAERSTSVFWSMLSGNFYFKERHFLIKALALLFLIIGFILLLI